MVVNGSDNFHAEYIESKEANKREEHIYVPEEIDR